MLNLYNPSHSDVLINNSAREFSDCSHVRKINKESRHILGYRRQPNLAREAGRGNVKSTSASSYNCSSG